MKDIRAFEPLWGNWFAKELIGKGSFGKVYIIEKSEYGKYYTAALKHIKVPQSYQEAEDIIAEGIDPKTVERCFEESVQKIIDEFGIMARLRGHDNIVNYESYKVIKSENSISWDIFIRMELLTSLTEYIQNNAVTQKDIIKLGIDVCKALEFCNEKGVVHKSVKPENIFVSKEGNFKIGDQGFSVDTKGRKTKYSDMDLYLAPEIFKEENYDNSSDIYSLGLVMYRFLNNNKLPFFTAGVDHSTSSEKEEAFFKRMGGQKFSAPENSDGELSEIVLKACEYSPANRFSSPTQMREELENLLHSIEARESKEDTFIKNEFNTNTGEDIFYSEIKTEETQEVTKKQSNKRARQKPLRPYEAPKRKLDLTLIACVVVALVAVFTCGFMVFGSKEKVSQQMQVNEETHIFTETQTEATTMESITEETVVIKAPLLEKDEILQEYIIQNNDNGYSICKKVYGRYNLDIWKKVMECNGMEFGQAYKEGQILYMPKL
ncbi:MAG: protein kinase [Firmicutes bacterium]|nr:protein kinase [Bacillota bacterium]